MRSVLRSFCITCMCLLALVVSTQTVAACTDPTDCQKQIDELSAKLAAVQKESKTLSSEINYLNLKQALTQRQIDATQFQIQLLQRDIDSLSGKITLLEGSLNNLTESLLKNVKASYEHQSTDDLNALLSSKSFSTAVSTYRYLVVAQKYRQDLLIKTTQTKFEYDQEKENKEKKQEEMARLKKNYEKQKQELAVQQKAKQVLLTETKNSEANYQRQLAQALAEKNALEGALISGVNVGPVKRGDPIALIGNSGYPSCSTAKHLHFEVRKNNAWVDPAQYLQSKSIIDDQEGRAVTIGSGSWNWPIEDPIRMTQHFGHTPWSYRYLYSGRIHTGFDLVSKSSDVIRAPADGTLYKSSERCGSSTINIVYIDHGDDLKSFYLHVQ